MGKREMREREKDGERQRERERETHRSAVGNFDVALMLTLFTC